MHRQLLGQARLLQRDAQALAQGVVIFAPAHPQYLDLAGGGGQQPFEDFDGGGLAGAVGPEQAEALSRLDFEVEAVDGVHGRRAGGVLFAQVAAADGEGSHAGIISNQPGAPATGQRPPRRWRSGLVKAVPSHAIALRSERHRSSSRSTNAPRVPWARATR